MEGFIVKMGSEGDGKLGVVLYSRVRGVGFGVRLFEFRLFRCYV